MLETLQPAALRFPERVIELIPPRPLGYYGSRELFNSHTDPMFDPLGAAETAANMTADLLFNAERAARLVDFESRNAENLGFGEMVNQILESTIKAEKAEGYEGAIQRTVDYVVLHNFMELAADEEASSQVRAVAHQKLSDLESWLETRAASLDDTSQKAAYNYMAKQITDFIDDPASMEEVTEPLSPPPGSPIGNGYSPLYCDF